MKATRKDLDRKLGVINGFLAQEGKGEYNLEIDSYRPGRDRLYRLTTHNGSRKVSDYGTLSSTIVFADGVLTGLAYWAKPIP